MTATGQVVDALAPTGVLRAVINLGNPVLAQGTRQQPAGVTVDLARELSRRLGVEGVLECVDAARHSFSAVADGRADVGFLAVEPERATQVAFTAPYALIEGVFAVPEGSPVRAADDVDRPGVRVGVKQGSAYDLYLTRTLEHAEVVRGADGVLAFEEGGLEVAAGIRQPLTRYVAEHPGLRVVEPRFTEIRQAVATGRDRDPVAVAWLRDTVADLVADGFVAASLARSGQDATVPA
ncbi:MULTISPECIES: transporter substrate-binding domain-containing protein [unclassified Isoptericola]|uniref:transporter substrate-binding domain-containing protein n=1 Tax=unclassified Isoptericola TaxID=2623355 RepID=UPI0036593A80